MEELREETEEVEGDSGGARVFFSNNGVEVLRKTLSIKGFIEEIGDLCAVGYPESTKFIPNTSYFYRISTVVH